MVKVMSLLDNLPRSQHLPGPHWKWKDTLKTWHVGNPAPLPTLHIGRTSFDLTVLTQEKKTILTQKATKLKSRIESTNQDSEP